MAHSVAEDALGFVFIGVLLSVFLYGIIVCQTYFYFRQYPRDQPWMKGFVSFLVFADTLHTFFSSTFLYDKVIIHFDDNQAAQYSNWLFEAYPALVGIISACVQLFFVWRVKVLTKNLWLAGLVALLSLSQIAGGLAYAIEAGRVHKFSNFLRFRPVILVWLAASAVCDILITASLTWALQKHKAQPLILAEDLIKRIIRLTIQNGLITTIWTVADLFIVIFTNNGAHFIFCFTLAKLYVNSLFSTLNGRPIVRDTVNTTHTAYSTHSRLVSTDSWDNFQASISAANNTSRGKVSADDLSAMARTHTAMSPLRWDVRSRQTAITDFPSPPPSSLPHEFSRN